MMMRATRIRTANTAVEECSTSTRTIMRNGAGQLAPSLLMSTRERIAAPAAYAMPAPASTTPTWK
jgi:hypothetical protein